MLPLFTMITIGRQGFMSKGVKDKNSNYRLNSLQKIPKIKNLTHNEIRERRAKGLCFNCNEKYEAGHKCQRLFLIDCCEEEDQDGSIIQIQVLKTKKWNLRFL